MTKTERRRIASTLSHHASANIAPSTDLVSTHEARSPDDGLEHPARAPGIHCRCQTWPRTSRGAGATAPAAPKSAHVDSRAWRPRVGIAIGKLERGEAWRTVPLPVRCGTRPCDSRGAECRVGHESQPALQAGQLLSVCMSAGTGVGPVESPGNFLQVSPVHGPSSPTPRLEMLADWVRLGWRLIL